MLNVRQQGRASVPMRRQVILDDLRAHPLSSAREISDRLLSETGGAPALLTGALYIPQWMVYDDLRAMERNGQVCVWRDSANTRKVAWQIAEETAHA